MTSAFRPPPYIILKGIQSRLLLPVFGDGFVSVDVWVVERFRRGRKRGRGEEGVFETLRGTGAVVRVKGKHFCDEVCARWRG
jgi:hypothetical protein